MKTVIKSFVIALVASWLWIFGVMASVVYLPDSGIVTYIATAALILWPVVCLTTYILLISRQERAHICEYCYEGIS